MSMTPLADRFLFTHSIELSRITLLGIQSVRGGRISRVQLKRATRQKL
jgi:hypothetical protein